MIGPSCSIEYRRGKNCCKHCGKWLKFSSTPTINKRERLTPYSLTSGFSLQHGRYVIRKALDRGGMGVVFLANDTRLAHKSLVLKALLLDDASPLQHQEEVRNFRREAGILAQIDHPLVPKVTDYFREGSSYYMVQEYVEGENLQVYMDRVNQPMKELVALRYAADILDILDYLEGQVPAIVHRDIKPANIILGAKDGRPHLVDFGIAWKATPSHPRRRQTSALGTPGYAPPEQYQENADPRSDIYALAATLHYILTDCDPSTKASFRYAPVRMLNPQLSSEIEAVLAHALIHDVNKRYQSAQAMKHDIDSILLRYGRMAGLCKGHTREDYTPLYVTSERVKAPRPTQGQRHVQASLMQHSRNHPRTLPYQHDAGQQPSESNIGPILALCTLAAYLIVGLSMTLNSIF